MLDSIHILRRSDVHLVALQIFDILRWIYEVLPCNLHNTLLLDSVKEFVGTSLSSHHSFVGTCINTYLLLELILEILLIE